MKFTKHSAKQAREITPRRIKCSENFLKKEREKLPLLTSWIAENQPTALERIEKFKSCREEQIKIQRDKIAARWKECRRIIYNLPPREKEEILKEWNGNGLPKSDEYLRDFLRRKLNQ